MLRAKPAVRGIFPVRLALSLWTSETGRSDLEAHMQLGDRGTPACARCRESGRPCTRSFNVRFSKRRAWAPPALSSSSSPPRLRGPSHTSPNPENISERSEQPCRLETPSQFHSDPESPDCVVEASAKNGYASPNSSDTTDLCGSTQSQSQQIVHLISPPLTLAPEDASLLQYFGDCVGRPW